MKHFDDLILPPDLRLLFVDETAVHAVHESLKVLGRDTDAKLQEEQAGRTFFQKTLEKLGRTEAPTKLEQDGAKIKKALAICETLLLRLKAELEKEVEWFLRENCESYKRGLAAGILNEDWHRAILAFQEALRAYIRELGQSRNMAVTNYNMEACQISDIARDAIQKAVLTAHELVQHTEFVNQVVDRQHEMVKGTPVADIFLPRLPVGDYVGWTQALPSKEIGPMQSHYDHILTLCETLVGPGIIELELALEEFQALNHKANASFVHAFMDRNREVAQSRWFNPGTIKQILARLEAKYETPAMPYTFELSSAPA
jgi:hypothetical protein